MGQNNPIHEDVFFTKGRIIVQGKTVKPGVSNKADYILHYKPNLPLAVVETKDNTPSIGPGMAQALEYAEIVDVPFIYTFYLIPVRDDVEGCRDFGKHFWRT